MDSCFWNIGETGLVTKLYSMNLQVLGISTPLNIYIYIYAINWSINVTCHTLHRRGKIFRFGEDQSQNKLVSVSNRWRGSGGNASQKILKQDPWRLLLRLFLSLKCLSYFLTLKREISDRLHFHSSQILHKLVARGSGTSPSFFWAKQRRWWLCIQCEWQLEMRLTNVQAIYMAALQVVAFRWGQGSFCHLPFLSSGKSACWHRKTT